MVQICCHNWGSSFMHRGNLSLGVVRIKQVPSLLDVVCLILPFEGVCIVYAALGGVRIMHPSVELSIKHPSLEVLTVHPLGLLWNVNPSVTFLTTQPSLTPLKTHPSAGVGIMHPCAGLLTIA